MSTQYYNDEFKKQVVQEYMKGLKSTIEIAAEYNIAKSTVSHWAKKYSEECQYTTKSNESESTKEIRRLNQELREKEKEITFLKKQRHSSPRKSISGISVH